MNQSIVRIEQLSHRYAIQWAVKDLNLEVTKPGIYGLLGANGAGKSTTMNIMCGVLKQTHGEVYIKNISLSKEPVRAKRHIGFLPQHPPLSTELTVEEFLIYCANLRMMPSKDISRAVDEVLAKCQISHFRKRLISNLSGGYQQRVGIAQAIIHKPDFVVLDEPTNGLDPNQITEVRGLIREIATERTVVLSTHILQEVQALCDNIWMIDEGQMVFSGTTLEFNGYIQPTTLTLSLRNSPGPDALKILAGVESVEELEKSKYRVKYINAVEATDSLVAASLAGNWGLEELTPDKVSMDTIFAEMTRKQQA